MIPVDFVTNIAPHYRASLWRTLLQMDGFDIRIHCGRNRNSSIKQIDFSDHAWWRFEGRRSYLKNRYLGRRLIWQSGLIRRALVTDARVAIILGDMNIVSSWVGICLLRLRGVKVLLWGHGMYGSERRLRRWLRLRFLRLADMNLVYGTRARRILTANGIDSARVRTIYNSLDHEANLSLRKEVIDQDFYPESGFFDDGKLPVLIFVGRLAEQKRLDRLIDVVRQLNLSQPRCNLCLVGDGPARPTLERQARAINGHVHFEGACYDQKRIGRLIANAELCVSPGEVGLTAIHCLSFGTPVCTHNDFARQMPEVESIEAGTTGTFFDLDRNNLGQTIIDWLEQKPSRENVRRTCYEMIDELWNPNNQISILHDALSEVLLPDTNFAKG